jgi:hypothetical protein
VEELLKFISDLSIQTKRQTKLIAKLDKKFDQVLSGGLVKTSDVITKWDCLPLRPSGSDGFEAYDNLQKRLDTDSELNSLVRWLKKRLEFLTITLLATRFELWLLSVGELNSLKSWQLC